MKKIIICAMMMVSSVAMFAQSAAGSVRFTPYVGLSLATMTNGEGVNIKPGLVAGAEAMYAITDKVGLSGGVFFEMQGCKGKEDGVSVSLNNNYINVPILANVYVAPGLAIKAGLQPGFLVSAKASGSAMGVSASVDMKDAYNTFDLSVPVGLSYEIKNFVIDARYNFGVLNVFSDADSDSSRNSVFQLMLGYRF